MDDLADRKNAIRNVLAAIPSESPDADIIRVSVADGLALMISTGREREAGRPFRTEDAVSTRRRLEAIAADCETLAHALIAEAPTKRELQRSTKARHALVTVLPMLDRNALQALGSKADMVIDFDLIRRRLPAVLATKSTDGLAETLPWLAQRCRATIDHVAEMDRTGFGAPRDERAHAIARIVARTFLRLTGEAPTRVYRQKIERKAGYAGRNPDHLKHVAAMPAISSRQSRQYSRSWT